LASAKKEAAKVAATPTVDNSELKKVRAEADSARADAEKAHKTVADLEKRNADLRKQLASAKKQAEEEENTEPGDWAKW
jgi:predicted  nucleic acid-binding Zn-ribbon protein